MDAWLTLPSGLPVIVSGIVLAGGVGLAFVRAMDAHGGDSLLEPLIGIILVGVIGGRLGFVILNWTYFAQHLDESWQIWAGGFSWFGGAVSISLAVLCVGLRDGREYRLRVDRLVLSLAPVVTAAWLIAWLEGTAYGAVTTAWWGVPSVDSAGLLEKRYPVQLLGALGSLLLILFLDVWLRRTPSLVGTGLPAGLLLLGNALLVWGLSALRADPIPFLFGYRLDRVASWIFGGASLIWLILIGGTYWRPTAHTEVKKQE